MVRFASEMSLYVNGVLDSRIPLTDNFASTKGPLFIGGPGVDDSSQAEGTEGACTRMHLLLDEVRQTLLKFPSTQGSVECMFCSF